MEINTENNIAEEDSQIEHNDTKKEEKTVEQLEHHIEDLSDRLLRAVAETENIRRRYDKQMEDIKEYAIINFAKDLISVLDNLARAIEFQPENISPENKGVLDGVVMTYKELESVLARHGVAAIRPEEGDKFDYNLHQAISQVESETIQQDSVVSLMQVGYKIKERLLRPAAVSVAKAKDRQ